MTIRDVARGWDLNKTTRYEMIEMLVREVKSAEDLSDYMRLCRRFKLVAYPSREEAGRWAGWLSESVDLAKAFSDAIYGVYSVGPMPIELADACLSHDGVDSNAIMYELAKVSIDDAIEVMLRHTTHQSAALVAKEMVFVQDSEVLKRWGFKVVDTICRSLSPSKDMMKSTVLTICAKVARCDVSEEEIRSLGNSIDLWADPDFALDYLVFAGAAKKPLPGMRKWIPLSTEEAGGCSLEGRRDLRGVAAGVRVAALDIREMSMFQVSTIYRIAMSLIELGIRVGEKALLGIREELRSRMIDGEVPESDVLIDLAKEDYIDID